MPKAYDIQHPPVVQRGSCDGSSSDIHDFVAKPEERRRPKGLREEVRQVIVSRDKRHGNLEVLDCFADVEMTPVDVLRVMARVLSPCHLVGTCVFGLGRFSPHRLWPERFTCRLSLFPPLP